MSKLYALLAVVGAALLGFLKVFSMGATSKANKIKAEQEEAAREYQNAGSEALINGLEREEKVKNEKSDTDPLDHFLK